MDDTAFTLEVDTGPGRTLLRLAGELDLGVTGELETALSDAEAAENGVLVLDLRALTFIDSTGLRVIVAAHARAAEGGRRLVVVRGPAEVQRVFELTHFAERLEMVDAPPEG